MRKEKNQSHPQFAMNDSLLKDCINASMSNGRCSMQSGEQKEMEKDGKGRERNNKNVRDEERKKQFEGENVRRG